MKAFFSLGTASSSSGSAAESASITSFVGSNAECYATNSSRDGSSAEQPVRQSLRSITDVQLWLKNDEVVLTSSAEATRISAVVDALSTKPHPRHQAIACFFKPWGVQQFIKNHRMPLAELIEELIEKVVDAAKKLQQQL